MVERDIPMLSDTPDGEEFLQARIAKLEAEVERLQARNIEHEMRLDAEEAKSEFWKNRAEDLSRTGAVKVLEWERRWMNAESQTEIGLYNITYRRDGSFEWSVGDHKGWAATWDNAKAAAQADYERRILSALEKAEPEGQQPVGTAGTMPGTSGFTMAAFKASDVPLGTPLYTRPSEQAVENNLCTLCDTVFSGDICPSCRGHISRRPPEQAVTEALPQDVIDLVIAARIVAFEDQSPEKLHALDKASEAFASRVPWDDDPEALKAAMEAGG